MWQWAAARWERYGSVTVATGLGRSDLTIETVRRYRLSPDRGTGPSERAAPDFRGRRFRIAPAASAPDAGERTVERVRDAWGREWALVFGRSAPAP